MNRRKKANQILKKRHKKNMAKLSGKPKRDYVPKAERERLAAAGDEACEAAPNEQASE